MMQSEARQTQSIWMQSAETPSGEALSGDLATDVCVIGAGIAGLSVAYLLAREGRAVVVLDDGRIGNGETGRTTAHLSNAIDDRYYEVERVHGAAGSARAAESHTAAISLIADIVAEEEIDCSFERVPGYLFLGREHTRDRLDRELKAAHRAGLGDVLMKDRAPGLTFDTGPCLFFPGQGQFHPLRYLDGLARAIRRDGGRIFTGAHVAKLEDGSIDGSRLSRLVTAGGPAVTAQTVVVATNTPVNERVAIHLKQASYRTYVIACRIPRDSVPPGLYWDTEDPYHYVRLFTPRPDGFDVLIVGGEDHKTGQEAHPEERHDRLEAWARSRFPVEAIEAGWSGQILETSDGLAYIGPDPTDAPRVFIATGDSGMGMTHGTIAGMLLTDLIQGRANPWAALYDPSRVRLKSAGTMIKENVSMAAHYAGWVTGGDVSTVEEIAPGSGAVLRRGLKKIAVYREPGGSLHEMSATCPHLGCIVRWNSLENSWDCPCHGSRFGPHGRVLNGPALSDLSPIEAPVHSQKER